MKKIILIFFGCIVALSSFALNVVFRFDDYQLKEDSFQNELVSVFTRQEVPLCIAIIPCYDDSVLSYHYEDGAYLLDLKQLVGDGRIDVALHGCRHKGAINYGEFYQMPYEEQKRLLARGSAHLDSVFGRHVHMFIPPWNMYDSITLRVLDELGFDAISSELNERQYFGNPHFQYYPMTVNHPKRLMQEVEWNAERDALLVCMFHRYDITEDFTLTDLENLIYAIKNHPSHPQILSFEYLTKTDSSFTESRMRANMKKPLLSKVLNSRHVLRTEKSMRMERIANVLIYALVLVCLMIVCAWKLRDKRFYYVIQCITVAILLVAVWESWLTTRVSGLLGLAIVIGMAIMWRVVERIKR